LKLKINRSIIRKKVGGNYMITFSGCAIGDSCTDNGGIIFLIILGVIALLCLAFVIYKLVTKGKK
jgi:amino acid transporter